MVAEKIPVYEAYGPKWEKEMHDLSKSNLIKRLRAKANEVDRLAMCVGEQREVLDEMKAKLEKGA